MSNFSFPKTCIRDASGNALVGAKLYFFEVGTTTPKDTYQDYELTVANTNPVITGSDGFTPPIFAVADGYKIVATDADDVALPGYSHDEYWPSIVESSGVINVTSNSSTPALTATNTGSGPGAKIVNSGTGHALEVEGDTSSPAKAPFYVVPIDSDPSSPIKGTLYPRSSGGGWRFYDGVSVNNVVGQRFCGGDEEESIGLVGDAFSTYHILPANSIIAGVGVRVRASVTVTAQVGNPDLTVQLSLGDLIGQATMAAVSVGDRAFFDCFVYIPAVGAAVTAFCNGVVAQNTGAGVLTAGCGDETPLVIDTTAAIAAAVLAIRVGGTSATLRLDFLSVDVA
jgi:hypothetical protein